MRADAFRAIADPTRRAILDLLRASECTVTELRRSFRMSQPAISKHLRILRRAGLVSRQRVGRYHYYRVSGGPVKGVYDWAARHLRAGPRRPPRP